MKKIKLGLQKLDIPTKIQRVNKVIELLSGNNYFPEPDPSISIVSKMTLELEKKYLLAQEARIFAQERTSEQNSAEYELDNIFKQLAIYIEHKSQGDIEKIKSVGFDVVGENRSPIGKPSQVQNLNVSENGNAGTLKLKWNSVKGARSYIIQRTNDINYDDNWKDADISIRTKINLENLVSGQKYWFRIIAVGSAGKSEPSEPVSKYAP